MNLERKANKSLLYEDSVSRSQFKDMVVKSLHLEAMTLPGNDKRQKFSSSSDPKKEYEILYEKSMDVDNMIHLAHLSPFNILDNLKLRYQHSKIYTYIGNIVITLNPYKDLLIDGPEVMLQYFNRPTSTLPPHLYGLAEMVYHSTIKSATDHVIVISGESGSGKTEAFKRITRYLAAASDPKNCSYNTVAKRILDTTPLLESFGNATTLRNDNSSRFGKFVEIQFVNSLIVGAKITNFLLEKSRIVRQGEGERNYHVFYELLTSLDNTSKQRHHLKNVSDYNYLIQGGNWTSTTHSDPDGLAVLLEAWRTLALPKDEIDLCLRVVSAILHLGNLKFKGVFDGEKCIITNTAVTEIVASELGVEARNLERVIIMKLTKTKRESLWSPVREKQAKVNCDSIAKQIYAKFFERLVDLLNDRLAPPETVELPSKSRTIALLDIYGFENLPNNSLEQFCINYTNENLQRLFNFYIFELEQEEYLKEGIDWQYINFSDNRAIIQLIAEKPYGIIHLCNEEASLAAGTDESFLRKCNRYQQDHPNFQISPRARQESFTIVHFAGQIEYNIHGFVDKNRNEVRSEVLALLTQSSHPVVASMFREVQDQRMNTSSPGPLLKTPMVLSNFNNSLQDLMNKIGKNRPHFVRCIKPNMSKQPMVFEDSIVLDQLRCAGIFEATRIRKAGFPIRPDYTEFVRNYGFLLPKKHHQLLSNIRPPKESARFLLKHLSLEIGQCGTPCQGKDYELGKTRLFLHHQLALHLEAVSSILQRRSARIIQRAWRRRTDGLLERARQNAAKIIQAYTRGYLARRTNPEVAHYLANRMQGDEPEEPLVFLSDMEIANLEIPSDLVYILEEKSADQFTWLENHRVTKPKGSIRRLVQNSFTQVWKNYGRPVWDAQPLHHLLKVDRSRLLTGYRLASRQRPLLITQATEDQRDACIAASKLLLRLVHLPEQPIMEQFLMGSYLYQLALSHPSLHKEILVQLLCQALNWPEEASVLYDSDKEDESSLFEVAQLPAIGQSDWKAAVGEQTSRLPRASSEAKRRAYRRLWMHVAGVLTCGRLPETLKPVIVRFLRQHSPKRSMQICEDRLVMAPSIPRSYPPCLLEWRVNYTGNNMGINLTFPDGTSSVVHVGCFTRAETLAGAAVALRSRSAQLVNGWSLSVHTPDAIHDAPGYCYVMDLFSAFELPFEWCHFNKIMPHRIFPTYRLHAMQDDQPTQFTFAPPLTAENHLKLSISNGLTKVRSDTVKDVPRAASIKRAGLGYALETSSVPCIEKTVDKPKAVVKGSWSAAVRKMAQKRFSNISRSESNIRRAHSRRERKWRIHEGESLPRPRSPGDTMANVRLGLGLEDLSVPSDKQGVNRASATMPHEMRYYAYDNPHWEIRLRKEFISPRERIRTASMLNLLFSQVLTDLFCPYMSRLCQGDRERLLELLGDVDEKLRMEWLNQVSIGVKKAVVTASLKFPLYYGRFFPVVEYNSSAITNGCQWLVIGHHGIRLVHQDPNHPDFNIRLTFSLSEVKEVTTCRIPNIPGWRIGDFSMDEEGTAYTVVTESRRMNVINIIGDNENLSVYTDMADRICSIIKEFLDEYQAEMARIRERAERRQLPSQACGSVSPTYSDTSQAQSSQKEGARYICSPPLLSKGLRHRGSSILRSESPALSEISSLTSTNGLSDAQLKAYTEDQSCSISSPKILPKLGSLEIGSNPANGTQPRVLITRSRQTLAPSSSSNDHPMLPFAEKYFAQKSQLEDQLKWQQSDKGFSSMLVHSNSSDRTAAQVLFSFILQFCGEEETGIPAHALFRAFIEFLWKRPWMNDEVYCQLIKQTYQNKSEKRNGRSSVWLLLALTSLFVPTTEELLPYLLLYTNSEKKGNQLIETLSEWLNLVKRNGPRRRLPPDPVLISLTAGELSYQQNIDFPTGIDMLVTVGQLSSVRSVVCNLIKQFGATAADYVNDFAIFMSPKCSRVTTSETQSFIPLPYDDYFLDAVVYNDQNVVQFRRLWWTIPTDYHGIPKQMAQFLFRQICDEYLHSEWMNYEVNVLRTKTLADCAFLSALAYQGHTESTIIKTEELIKIKPDSLVLEGETWLRELSKHVKQANFCQLEAQTVFMETLGNWEMFGSVCFEAEVDSFLFNCDTEEGCLEDVKPARVTRTAGVVLGRDGLWLFGYPSLRTAQKYRYEEMASNRVTYRDKDDGCAEGIVVLTTSSGLQIKLRLSQAKMFLYVLNGYQRLLSVNILAAE